MSKITNFNIEDSDNFNPKSKSRYYCGVLYPESMIDDWETVIGDVLQLPYVYCVHDRDVDKNGDIRKKHMHLIIAFSNSTTAKKAYETFLLLQQPGKAVKEIQSVQNIRHMYDYLIHNTETARKQGKFQYSPKDRITGNNFDIGAYEQISVVEKESIITNLVQLIEKENFQDFYEMNLYVLTELEDTEAKIVFRQHHSYFYNLIKARYTHLMRVNGNMPSFDKKKEQAQKEEQEDSQKDSSVILHTTTEE